MLDSCKMEQKESEVFHQNQNLNLGHYVYFFRQ